MQPIIHFAHANGFPAATYRYFFEQLQPLPVLAIPQIGQTVQRFRSWEPFADEMIAFLEQQQTGPVVGVGHSLGGVVTYFAARKCPELFSRIILLDPPMFRPVKRKMAGLVDAVGLGGNFIPPAIKAKKRRRTFDDKEQAALFFKQKSLFRSFHPESFEDYIQYGLQESQSGVELVFPAEREYRIFCKTPSTFGPFRLKVPLDYVYSTKMEVTSEKDINHLRSYFKGVPFHAFDAGHMFPLEQPEATANFIKQLIL
jgi:pimeloyl-ACP methyl ester carboxylesterase